MLSGWLCLVIAVVGSWVINAVFPDFDDHTNKKFMAWDAIATTTTHFGVDANKLGHKMLGKNKATGEWKNVVLTRAQQHEDLQQRKSTKPNGPQQQEQQQAADAAASV